MVRGANLFFVVLSTTSLVSSCSFLRHEGKKNTGSPENKGPEENQPGDPEKNPGENTPIQNAIPEDLKKNLQTIIESYATPEDIKRFKLKRKISTAVETNKVTSRINYNWKDDTLESFEVIKSAADENPEYMQYRYVNIPGCSWSFTPGQNLFSKIEVYQNRPVYNQESYNPDGKIKAKTTYSCKDAKIISSINESYTDGDLAKVEYKRENFYTHSTTGLLEKDLYVTEGYQTSKEYAYVIENEKLATVEVKVFEKDAEEGDPSLKLKKRDLYDLKNRMQKSFLIDVDTERETGETVSYDMSVGPVTVFQSSIYNMVDSSDLTGRICKPQVDAFICESKNKRDSDNETVMTEKFVPVYAQGDVHTAVDSLSGYLGIPKSERYILMFVRVKLEAVTKSKATGKIKNKTVQTTQFNDLGKQVQYDYVIDTYDEAGESSNSTSSKSVSKYSEGGLRLDSVEIFKNDEPVSKDTYEY